MVVGFDPYPELQEAPPDEIVSGSSLIESDMSRLVTTSSSNSGLNLK